MKRPYSAEMRPVWTVVSWIASSMKRSCGCPRRFSLTTTPLTRNRFSKDIAPEIMIAGRWLALARLELGPFSLTPGASKTASRSARPEGSSFKSFCGKLAATSGPRSGGAWLADTLTDSATAASRRT